MKRERRENDSFQDRLDAEISPLSQQQRSHLFVRHRCPVRIFIVQERRSIGENHRFHRDRDSFLGGFGRTAVVVVVVAAAERRERRLRRQHHLGSSWFLDDFRADTQVDDANLRQLITIATDRRRGRCIRTRRSESM